MRRLCRALVPAIWLLAMIALPAAAQQEPVIDLEGFINSFSTSFPDLNGDGIPDIPEGDPGIWDEAMASATEADFMERVGVDESGFDLGDPGSTLVGPCGGVAISYSPEGESIDAVLDFGDEGPLLDIYGNQKMTESNPMRVDPTGVVAVWGFTADIPTLSVAGEQPGVDYGDPANAFHDHRWEVVILGVSGDNGGDPNALDENRNAGLVELGELLPFGFRAKVKATGTMIDLWGPEGLPDFDAENISAIAGSREYCFGEGWVEFVGDEFPLFTAPGALAAALFVAGFGGVLFNARSFLSWRS